MAHNMSVFMYDSIVWVYTYTVNVAVSGETVSADSYGDASGIPILLDDVKCTGSESNLLSCPQLPLGSAHDCTHTEDVAIVCQSEQLRMVATYNH